MQILIETIIYLLAVIGIILVSGSFFEMLRYTNIFKGTYSLFRKAHSKVEVIIKFTDVEEMEKLRIIQKIKKGDFENIEEIVDTIKIEEEFDNS